jgi:hypothetical protein
MDVTAWRKHMRTPDPDPRDEKWEKEFDRRQREKEEADRQATEATMTELERRLGVDGLWQQSGN